MPIYSSSHTVLHQCATFITVDEPVLINFYLFIYLAASGRWGMWDLSLWCVGFSQVVARGCSLSSCGAWASGCVGSIFCGTLALLLRHVSSVVVAPGLSWPSACGIVVPWPGIEPASLHWKADSLSLDHQRSPWLIIINYS